MKLLSGLFIAWSALAVAQARPLVVQESARITNPNPATYPVFAADVALDGDDAMATLERFIDPPPGGDFRDAEHEVAVYLFHRTTSGWAPVRQLAVQHHFFPFSTFDSGLAMRNGIAALALNPLRVFERSSGNWVSAPITGVDPSNPGDSIAIDGRRILFGGSSGQWMGTLYEKSSAGVWGPTSVMTGDNRNGDLEFSGGPVDISGGRAVILSPYNDEDPPRESPSVAVYRDWGPPQALPASVGDTQLRVSAARIRRPRYAAMRYSSLAPICQARASTGRGSAIPGRSSTAAAARQPHGWRGHQRHRKELSFHHAAQLERGASGLRHQRISEQRRRALRARGHSGVE
jgi:hypothetical protein